jgi:hypothetical protein
MKTKKQVIKMLVERGNNALYGGSPGPFSGVDFDAYAYVLEVDADDLYAEVEEAYEIAYPAYVDTKEDLERELARDVKELAKLKSMIERGTRKIGSSTSMQLEYLPRNIKRLKKEIKALA